MEINQSDILTTYNEPTFPLTRKEYFDDDNMKFLLSDDRFNKNDRSKLSNYNRHRRTGSTMIVEYKLADDVKDYNLGRLYPTESLGLQSYRFDIRNPLTAKYYWDIDMENSHPCIAEKLCIECGLEHQNISYYINNRDKCLSSISSDRKTAKTEILKILYGGEIKFYNEFYENCDGQINSNSNEFLRDLQREFTNLRNVLWDRNSHLHKIKVGGKMLSKKLNCKVSLMSLLLQTEERKLLLKIDYILEKKYNRNIGVFIHDGGLVSKQEGETSFPQEILDDISQIITSKTGIKTRLTQKPITYDWEPIRKMSPYETFKIEFEKKYKFVGSQMIYELDNGDIEYVKINDLKNRESNKWWLENCPITDKPVKKYFVNEWLTDPNRFRYERMDFIPNVKECPENVYNKFKGFKAEKLSSNYPNVELLTKEEIETSIRPILQHVLHLAGNDESGKLFILNILANIIQNPHKKSEVAILFRDENGFLRQGGGTGKSLFTNEFFGSKIIGDDYMIEVHDNADMYNTFNSQYAGKLLGIVEEADGENHSNGDKLKNKITSKRINVNTKGVAQFTMNDYLTYIFNTNNRNSLPIKQGNRRICVFDADQSIRRNEIYFTNLVECMEDPRNQYYFFIYLKHHITTYSKPIEFQNNIPINGAYIQMCQLNAPTYLKWITYNVKNGLVKDDNMRNIYNDYVGWIKEHRESKDDKHILSETAFGKLLEGDGNIIYAEDNHYCLLEVGEKTRTRTGMMYRWNMNNLITGLKNIYLLEPSFTYIEMYQDTDDEMA